jgi:hypothetical protein
MTVRRVMTVNASQIIKAMLLVGVVIASGAGNAAAESADRGRGTRGFFATELFLGISIPIDTELTEIQAFLGLPRGKYIANASAVLVSDMSRIHGQWIAPF